MNLSFFAEVPFSNDIKSGNKQNKSSHHHSLGIVYSCYLGIGYGVGTIIRGFLIDSIGGSWTFLVFGAVTVIMILFSLAALGISKLLERRQNNRSERNRAP